MGKPIHRSYFFKAIIVFSMITLTTLLIGFFVINRIIDNQKKESLSRIALTSHEIYSNKLEEITTVLEFTALRTVTVKKALISGDKNILFAALYEVKKASNLDFLSITDDRGQVYLRVNNPDVFGDNLTGDKLVSRVLESGTEEKCISVIDEKHLIMEGESLIKTLLERTNKITDLKNSSELIDYLSLILESAVPVKDEKGKLIGILYGGNFLFGNKEIVKNLKNAFSMNEMYKGKNTEIASFFFKDKCILSSAYENNEFLSIETPLSKTCKGDSSSGDAKYFYKMFVGNDTYVMTHDSIKDMDGNQIGILSVGTYEKKYFDLKKRVMIYFSGIILVVAAGVFWATYSLSVNMLSPFKKLVYGAKRIADGDFSFQFKNDKNDEAGELGRAFDFLVTSIMKRENEISELDEQICQSRRLAILGQLAAGVAHEINNPLGGIYVYAHLLQEDTSPEDPRYSNITKIIKESTRCKNIIKSLLDFSRQTHPVFEMTDLNIVIVEAINNIRREPVFGNIRLIENYDENLPGVMADSSQIQEVFENIIRNAAEIMNGDGTLKITSCIVENERNNQMAEIVFEDSGPGIPQENIDHIFDPFFTTKVKGHGTGLGLAVSYGIIERHNGKITARNIKGGGAAFTVRLRAKRI